jgi:hypothetical protein
VSGLGPEVGCTLLSNCIVQVHKNVMGVWSDSTERGGDESLTGMTGRLHEMQGPGTSLIRTNSCSNSCSSGLALQVLSPSPSSGKAPSPSQLSVTELPGDAIRLTWVATGSSGVLVYQIKWTPLEEGKAHEVQGTGAGNGWPFREDSPAPDPEAELGFGLRVCPPPSYILGTAHGPPT